jgi:hypothetical protein
MEPVPGEARSVAGMTAVIDVELKNVLVRVVVVDPTVISTVEEEVTDVPLSVIEIPVLPADADVGLIWVREIEPKVKLWVPVDA